MQAMPAVAAAQASRFNDPSMARGIRSSYFGSIDNAWKTYLANEKAAARRFACRDFANAKSFRKDIARMRKQRLPRFLPISEISASAGKCEVWMMLTLTSVCDKRDDAHFHDAVLVADVITYPADAKRSIMPVFFRRHKVIIVCRLIE